MAASFSLLDEVGPDLYRENAFKVIGLPVHASAREIRRRTEELRVAARLGTQPQADDTATRRAAQRLKDPVSRLVDEVFWLWPPSAQTDAHDKAVWAHSRALDHAEPDPEGRRLWKAAYRAWRTVVSDDGFWTLLVDRVRELSDPRLTGDTVTRIRADLPAALLSINARLAVGAYHDDGPDAAAWHFALMRESGFEPTTVEAALRRAVEPEVVRIRAAGERSVQSAAADAEHGDEVAARLLDQTAPPLALLTSALPADHSLLQGIRDEIATLAMKCTIVYANRTEDWLTVRELAERAQPIAATRLTIDRINDDLAVIRANLLSATCWFCAERPALDEAAYPQQLYGEIDRRVYGRVSWRTLTIKVPRCTACRGAHRQRRRVQGWSWLGSAVLALVISTWFAPALLFIAVPLGVVALVAVLGMAERPPELRIRQFGPVRDRLRNGWQLGTKPPGVR